MRGDGEGMSLREQYKDLNAQADGTNELYGTSVLKVMTDTTPTFVGVQI